MLHKLKITTNICISKRNTQTSENDMRTLSVGEFANNLTTDQYINLFDIATGGEFTPDADTSNLSDEELLGELYK